MFPKKSYAISIEFNRAATDADKQDIYDMFAEHVQAGEMENVVISPGKGNKTTVRYDAYEWVHEMTVDILGYRDDIIDEVKLIPA